MDVFFMLIFGLQVVGYKRGKKLLIYKCKQQLKDTFIEGIFIEKNH